MKKFYIFVTILFLLTGCSFPADNNEKKIADKTIEQWADESDSYQTQFLETQYKLKDLQEDYDQLKTERDTNENTISFNDQFMKDELLKDIPNLVNCVNTAWHDSLGELSKANSASIQKLVDDRNSNIQRCSANFLLDYGAIKMATKGELCKENPSSSSDCKTLNN